MAFRPKATGRHPARLGAALRRSWRWLLALVLGTASAVVYQEAGWAARSHLLWAAGVAVATALPKVIELRTGSTASRPELGAELKPDAAAPVPRPSVTPVQSRFGWSRVRSVARQLRLRRASKAPRHLPEPLKEFRDRTSELAALAEEYQVQSHSDRQAGPALLPIHGMPGVGKSALAQAYAHSRARDFPDGQLYANLGIAGAERDPSEILDGFLDALGKGPDDRPADGSARSKLFRSMTKSRRILILLDAARSADQVRQLLPTGTRCMVIVTSRRDLGPALGATSLRLSPLEAPDALQVLAAFAQAGVDQDTAAAAKVVELCGALPIALRSAGEQLRFGGLDLRGLVRKLEPSATRLDCLRYRGRDVEERFTTEYLRLDDLHRRAFRFLSLVKSPTFPAWTLVPLLAAGPGRGEGAAATPAVGPDEAESIAAQLASVQLLDVVGPAGEPGAVRYRLHPLVRLTAAKLLAGEARGDERGEAAGRLDAAYAALVSRLLNRREPEQQELRAWLLDPEWQLTRPVAERISSGTLEQWVRAEYLNLLRCVTFAHERASWGLCWRIAALLGSCVPEGVDQDAALRAFGLAERAADRARLPRGRVEVLLARGSFLAAVEQYGEAQAVIEQAIALTRQYADVLGDAVAVGLQAKGRRRLGEAWLQLAAYRRAHKELVIAQGLAEQVGDVTEASRIRLLITDGDSRMKAEHWFDRAEYVRALDNHPDDGAWFRAQLGLSERERREGGWEAAVGHLRLALGRNEGDARRKAAILYRAARVRLCQSATPSGAQNGALTYAIGYASAALLMFDTMRNECGVIRARCLLADALIGAGNLTEARHLVDLAEQSLNALASDGDTLEPLTARVKRSRGTLHLADDDSEIARERLVEAVEIFRRHEDWRAEADTLVLLGRAEHAARHDIDAHISLYGAARLYQLSKDEPALRSVQVLIASLDNR